MKYRVCLGAMYSCGLRLKEGLHLQVGDIDRDRLQIHVCHGKGGKERYVPLPEQTLKMLRQWIPVGCRELFGPPVKQAGYRNKPPNTRSGIRGPPICWKQA